MKKKTQCALGLLLASVTVLSSVSVGLSAWVSIDIKHDNASLQQELYTVKLMDEGGTKAAALAGAYRAGVLQRETVGGTAEIHRTAGTVLRQIQSARGIKRIYR